MNDNQREIMRKFNAAKEQSPEKSTSKILDELNIPIGTFYHARALYNRLQGIPVIPRAKKDRKPYTKKSHNFEPPSKSHETLVIPDITQKYNTKLVALIGTPAEIREALRL